MERWRKNLLMVKINMIKHSNGLYEDKGAHHHHFYKMINNSLYRYSKVLDEWILCLDEKVIKEIKLMEKLSEEV